MESDERSGRKAALFVGRQADTLAAQRRRTEAEAHCAHLGRNGLAEVGPWRR